MPAPASAVTLLVRRVRTRLWLEVLLARLRRCLWIATPILVLGGLLRWRLGSPGLSLLAPLAGLPLLLALLATVRHRPTPDSAAAAADRRLRAESLLVTAWHLEQDRGRGAGAAPLVLERARRALPGWEAGMSDARPTLQTGRLFPPLLALLASLPLLGLEPVSRTPLPGRDRPEAAAPAAPVERGAPLSDLVTELKASEIRPEPMQATSPPTAVAGSDATAFTGKSSAGLASARTPQDEQSVRVDLSASAPMATEAGDDREPAQATGGDGTGGAAAGRESAGTEAATATDSVRDAGAGEAVPARPSALRRREADHSASKGPGGILVPDARLIGTHSGAAAPPAEPPPGMESGLEARGPARRSLIARFFEISRQQDND